jgi:hypothetical protein
MKLVGAHLDASIAGEEELPGKFNCFIGNEPSRWRTNVPTFAKVRYREVYPGIDLMYYGNEGQLEYDLVVAPGADPSRIELAIEGADAVEVDANGDLRLEVAGQELRWRKPVLFQEVDGERVPVAGEYVLRPAPADHHAPTPRRVRFRVASYNRMLALVIDPVLAYSTCLGGGLNDMARSIAVDAEGSAYVTGFTWSVNNFPTTANAITRKFTVNDATFVTKFSPAGNTLVDSTLLTGTSDVYGGSGGVGLAVDAAGGAMVTGWTSCDDFPTVNALQPLYGGGPSDAFVAKLSPDGSALQFSTFLGGSEGDSAEGLARDGDSNLYVTGRARSTDFPLVNAVQSEGNRFLAKLVADGSRLAYSTFVGGGDPVERALVAVDAQGRAYVGGTEGTAANRTVYVERYSNTGLALDYSNQAIHGLDAEVRAITLDAAGSVFLTGTTASRSLPTTAHAPQSTFGGGDADAFVAKLHPGGSALDYLTYLGGTRSDYPNAIAVDHDGNAWVAGGTESGDLPMVDAFQGTIGSKPTDDAPSDAFVCKLNPDGSRLSWSSYFGGAASGQAIGGDEAHGLSCDSAGAVYVAGGTASRNFPVQNAYQKTLRLESNWLARDAFVMKLTEPPPVPASVQISRSGNTVVISWPISITGFGLETSDSLAPAPNWMPESTPPEIVGDERVVTLEIGAGPKFFRLRKP